MTDRQRAVASAKAAYRLWLTHAIAVAGFVHMGQFYAFEGDYYTVFLKRNGAVDFTLARKEKRG